VDVNLREDGFEILIPDPAKTGVTMLVMFQTIVLSERENLNFFIRKERTTSVGFLFINDIVCF
jgi:hypothetical protein